MSLALSLRWRPSNHSDWEKIHDVERKEHMISKYCIVKRVYIVVITISLFMTTPKAMARTATTENVIIAIIDGIRYDEVTESNMPFLLGGIDPETGLPVPDPLKPQGCYYTNFFNTGQTFTTAAHHTIVTGVRQQFTNNRYFRVRSRTREPNIFEYYRKQKSQALSKVWVVAGKMGNLRNLDYSLHPAYGYQYRSSMFRNHDEYQPSDDEIYVISRKVMSQDHPSLMLLNFKDVDVTGHQGDYDNYVDAIKKADRLVYELWKAIQNDDHYKDRTTLIITTDHGRHSDGIADGFVNHGGYSRGDLLLLFLALGPEMKKNTEINVRRDLIDIAPTVGELLDFQAPYAEGEVMSEMFQDDHPQNVTVTGGERKPHLAVNDDGIHLVWSRKQDREWDILYQNSPDGGETWGDPLIVFQSSATDWYHEASITAGKHWIYLTATGYSAVDFGGESFTSKIWGRQCLTSTGQWEAAEILVDYKASLGSVQLSSRDDTICIVYSVGQKALWSLIYNQDSWTNERVDNQVVGNQSIYAYTSLVSNQSVVYIWSLARSNYTMSTDRYEYNWNLYGNNRSMNDGNWGKTAICTDNYNDRKFFLDPAMCRAGSQEIVLAYPEFVENEDPPAHWQITAKSSRDNGQTWTLNTPVSLSNPRYHAWRPKICGNEQADLQFLIWEYYPNPNGEVQGRLRRNNSWQPIINLTAIDNAMSVMPDCALQNNNLFYTWQDYSSGSWTISFQSLILE